MRRIGRFRIDLFQLRLMDETAVTCPGSDAWSYRDFVCLDVRSDAGDTASEFQMGCRYIFHKLVDRKWFLFYLSTCSYDARVISITFNERPQKKKKWGPVIPISARKPRTRETLLLFSINPNSNVQIVKPNEQSQTQTIRWMDHRATPIILCWR
jgi:hypothetical protein